MVSAEQIAKKLSDINVNTITTDQGIELMLDMSSVIVRDVKSDVNGSVKQVLRQQCVQLAEWTPRVIKWVREL